MEFHISVLWEVQTDFAVACKEFLLLAFVTKFW